MNKHKTKNPQANPRRKWLIIAACGIFLLLAVPAAIVANHFIRQQKVINELAVASRELREVYENILSTSKADVSNSEYRNECTKHVSYTGWIKDGESVSCGPSGNIQLKKEIDTQVAKRTIESAVEAAKLKHTSIVVDDEDKAVRTDISIDSITTENFSCSVYYGQNALTFQWYYSTYCVRSNIWLLPGYTVKG